MSDSIEMTAEAGATPGKVECESKLDNAIERATVATEAREGEREEFHRSRGDRAELKSRYGERGHVGEAIDRFVFWDTALRQNPGLASEHLAASYLEQFNLGDDARRTAPGQSAEGKDRDIHPGQKLDRAIDRAIDEVDARGRDDEEFSATAEQRAALKKMFPQLSFPEAVKRIAHLDAAMWRDPLGTAQRIGASYGLPATPLQHAMLEVAGARTELDRGTEAFVAALQREGELPELEALAPDMTEIMQAADFPWSGDAGRDLRTAYALANRRAAEERSRARDTKQTAQRK